MEVLATIADLRRHLAGQRNAGQRIGLVPTMGNLHQGHLRLVQEAAQQCSCVVVSIFVNPTQFGPGEDLASYPRTLDADLALLAGHAQVVFTPKDAELYPQGPGATRVQVQGLTDILCGAARPGHFDGVATVVTKLLNIVQPDRAYFGCKDYQQLAVIRSLVQDLNLPVAITGVPTVRAADGLALSSRNGYLDASQRAAAPALYHSLQALVAAAQAGERDWPELERQAAQRLLAAGFAAPDYLSVRRQQDLAAPTAGDRALVVLAAARLGRARLIDNLEFHLDD